MNIERWLIIGKSGSCEMRAKPPRPTFTEVAVKLHLVIPDALFQRPHIEARLVVPDEVVTPPVVSVETETALVEAFAASGLRVELVMPGGTP